MAIQSARKGAGLSQIELAERIGIDQPRLSRYIRGVDLVPYDLLPQIDEACGQPRGHVLRLAGFVDDGPLDLVAALTNDPRLADAVDRHAIVVLYRAFLEREAQPAG